MSVRGEAQRLIRDLKNGERVGVDFAHLYRSFSVEIVLLIDDLAKFELKEDYLATFKAVQKMYNALNAGVGGTLRLDCCIVSILTLGILLLDRILR